MSYISLGALAINDKHEPHSWVLRALRYKWMRFFGFTSARVFVGFIVASKEGPGDAYHDRRVKFHEDQLSWALSDRRAANERKQREGTTA